MKDIVKEFIEKTFKSVMKDMDESEVEMIKAKKKHKQFEKEFNKSFKKSEERINKIRKNIQDTTK